MDWPHTSRNLILWDNFNGRVLWVKSPYKVSDALRRWQCTQLTKIEMKELDEDARLKETFYNKIGLLKSSREHKEKLKKDRYR